MCCSFYHNVAVKYLLFTTELKHTVDISTYCAKKLQKYENIDSQMVHSMVTLMICYFSFGLFRNK